MKILISTFGPDPENTLAGMRALPYQKLVLVLSQDAKDTPGFRRIIESEGMSKGIVETLNVDEFDLKACFREIANYILASRMSDKKKTNQIFINVSGGSKILGDAALLVAFQMGIPAFHCEKTRIVKFPIIQGMTLRDRFTDSQIAVLKQMGMRDTIDDITEKIGPGLTEETIRKSLRILRKLGVIRTVPTEGKIMVELTEPGILILETINRFEKIH